MKGMIWMIWLMHLVMVSFGQEKMVIKDPNVQKREIGAFHGVEVSGSINLFISQDPESKVLVSARNLEDIDKIVTVVKNGVLHIYFKPERDGWHVSIGRGRELRAYVSASVIRSISTLGSGTVHMEGVIKSEKLDLNSSGSGGMYGRIDVKELDFDKSGSGTSELKGYAQKASLSTSGSGNINSLDLSVDICDVSTSGSGSAEITVNKEISTSTSGSGSIRFKGEGLLANISTSGSGKVKRIK